MQGENSPFSSGYLLLDECPFLNEEVIEQYLQHNLLRSLLNGAHFQNDVFHSRVYRSRELMLKNYTIPAMEQRVSKPFDKTREPHFLFQIIRCSGMNQTQFIATEQGMLQSQKNTTTEDIMIGRMKLCKESNCVPNDIGICLLLKGIVLPNNDKHISKIHCKIITKPTFESCRQVPKEFYIFCGSAISQRLPRHLLSRILRYTKQCPKIYIQDLGSEIGTLIKLSCRIGRQIDENQQFVIGADTRFKIKEIGYFGNDKYQVDRLIEKYNNLQIKNRNGRPLNNRAYIILRLNNQFYMLVVENNQNIDTFKLGRNQDSDIHISQNTISRRQCRIIYQNNGWMIFDGEYDKESSNGSWLEMKSQNFEETKIHEFQENIEIKISDTVMRIEMHNFSNGKQVNPFNIDNLLN